MHVPNHRSNSKHSILNDPQNILNAWTVFEVLSPQSYQREADFTVGDSSRIARLDSGVLPWESGEKSLPNKRLFYELIFRHNTFRSSI
jgi:hypothetical protein